MYILELNYTAVLSVAFIYLGPLYRCQNYVIHQLQNYESAIASFSYPSLSVEAGISSSLVCDGKLLSYSHTVSFSADELINTAFYAMEFFRR
jgi:hypothetical protein